MTKIKKLRFFAGPNGSGKTTLIKKISEEFNIGYLINADDIEVELKNKGFIDCAEYSPRTIEQADWLRFVKSPAVKDRFESLDFGSISIKENYLLAKQVINSYQASIIAEFFRTKLLLADSTFSFETVMSHPSKVSFLQSAKENGFKTYLYFICTQDPKINIQRIKNRVEEGGHNVLIEKVTERYYRTLNLLYPAFEVVDRAFIVDSSGEDQDVILEKDGKNVTIYPDTIPEWVDEYLLNNLK